jgi:hypothetical protein
MTPQFQKRVNMTPAVSAACLATLQVTHQNAQRAELCAQQLKSNHWHASCILKAQNHAGDQMSFWYDIKAVMFIEAAMAVGLLLALERRLRRCL